MFGLDKIDRLREQILESILTLLQNFISTYLSTIHPSFSFFIIIFLGARYWFKEPWHVGSLYS